MKKENNEMNGTRDFVICESYSILGDPFQLVESPDGSSYFYAEKNDKNLALMKRKRLEIIKERNKMKFVNINSTLHFVWLKTHSM